jgi:aminoglycoside phosphotransferase (APT) family kinase protein
VDAADGGSSVIAHGDFSFNQVMWCDGRVTALLDLEMSHAESPDWDLPSFLGFCADPARMVPEHLEEASRPEEYREAPGWLRQAYPEMFGHPRQRDRLLLHFLVFRAEELLADPGRVDEIVGASLEEVRAMETLLPG